MKRRNNLRKILSQVVFKRPKGKGTSMDVFAAHVMTSMQVWCFSKR